MGRRKRVVLAALLLAGLVVALQVRVRFPSRPVGSIEALSEPRQRPLNVVFILVDTLRADHVGSYGYERNTTPLLDAYTASGVRFENVEAQSSWTKCSMASLWMAVSPPRTGVTRFDHALPAGATLPAELFRKAGYTTAGIWRNGWIAPSFGFNRGFDLYIRPTGSRGGEPRALERQRPGAQQLKGNDLEVSEAAIEFLRTRGDEPVMLYLHYMDLHQYAYDEIAADQGFGASLIDSYDAALHWTDRNIAWLLHELEEQGLMDNTLVVIASDHGEAFREHGIEGHARNLYREVTRVPLIFLLPFRLSEPLVVEPMVRNVDIWPTILDIAGLPSMEGRDGQSLVPLMQGAARGERPTTPRSWAYLDQHWANMEIEESPLVSISEPRGRMEWNTTDPRRTLRVFDHQSDPAEQRNLARSPPEWSADLRRELEENLARPLPWGEGPKVEVDEMYKAQLKALGYVAK
jgi:arylsulfatase A-like enzyme